MISDEAVEAAAKALFRGTNSGSPWDDADLHWWDAYKERVRAALEAAAPHMLAEAKNAAFIEGLLANPYRG